MSNQAIQARSLYRRFLRELPTRHPSILANPSPIQHHIRADFASTSQASPSKSTTTSILPPTTEQQPSSATFRLPHNDGFAPPPSLIQQIQKPAEKRLEEAQQYLHYLRSQRQYITLLERYNPGMNMNEEEKVRLTARRVGMDLPEEFVKGGGKA